MSDTEKALKLIYKRLGEIRDVLCEIRDGMIDIEGDDEQPDNQGDEQPDAAAGPRAVP